MINWKERWERTYSLPTDFKEFKGMVVGSLQQSIAEYYGNQHGSEWTNDTSMNFVDEYWGIINDESLILDDSEYEKNWLQTGVCFKLSKIFRKNPIQIAEEIVAIEGENPFYDIKASKGFIMVTPSDRMLCFMADHLDFRPYNERI